MTTPTRSSRKWAVSPDVARDRGYRLYEKGDRDTENWHAVERAGSWLAFEQGRIALA